MTESGEYSRREFLKTFAILSSASIFVGLNSGCGSSEPRGGPALYGPIAAYGPPPANLVRPEVVALYYIDSQSKQILLQNNLGVFVQVVCCIDFSKPMNTSASLVVDFADSAGNAVLFSKSWKNDLTLLVAPLSLLQFNSTYTFSVGDAEDTFGNKLSLTADATATFRTVSA